MECSVHDCDYPARARGMCSAHYARQRRLGSPTAGGLLRRYRITEAQAFAAYMPGNPPEEGCWDWTGYTDPNGYGRFGLAGKHIPAHVASYRIYCGPVTDYVLHDCDRRICVQPKHLHLGSNLENIAERNERNRTACGERSGRSKLTDPDVLWIRSTTLSNAKIADLLGVDRSTISVIRSGRTWRHLLPPD